MSPLVLVDAPKPAAPEPNVVDTPESIVSSGPSVPAPADADRLTDPRFARLNRGLLGFRIALYVSLGASLAGLDPTPGPGLFILLGLLALVPAIQVRALEGFRVETGVSISLAVAFALWWRFGSLIALEVLPLFSLAVSGLLLSRVRAAFLAGAAAALQLGQVLAYWAASSGYQWPGFHPVGDRSQLYARAVMLGLVCVVGVAFLRVGAILRDYQAELAATTGEEIRLTEIVRHKNSLINAVAHELRTPLTAVLGLSLALGDRHLALKDDDRWALARTVADESRRLANVLENLVVDARSEATGLATRSEAVDLAAEIETIWGQLDPPADWTLDVVGDGLALADRLRTRHLIKNLLDNSLRHGLSPVRVDIGAIGGNVVCCFRDAGGGVDRAIEGQLFHEYEPETAHTRAGGTGLGLRIARILARSMGGDLLYADGSFVLSLPVGSRDR
jgi:signal transduction histidine kinase